MTDWHTASRIIVAGFPKSGNTWVSRLSAEIAACPVYGAVDVPGYDDIACEGEERASNWGVFKTHMTPEALRPYVGPAHLLIHVVRDPRDIAVSAYHYFKVERSAALRALFAHVPCGLRAYYGVFCTCSYRRHRIVNAICRGDARISRWLSLPWHVYCAAHQSASQVEVRYEDLLKDPTDYCRILLNQLGMSRSPEFVAQAIERHSFASRRAAYKRTKQLGKQRFLRSGTSGQWQQFLDPSDVRNLESHLGAEMMRHGYMLSMSSKAIREG